MAAALCDCSPSMCELGHKRLFHLELPDEAYGCAAFNVTAADPVDFLWSGCVWWVDVESL